ncbi:MULTISPECIES: DUF350 domain-containing protein [Kitasatospora]|uniref:DUF350 domain-containing protein n=1 Tax=Kitasatospora setae (strain ATCC 33774 / DSM 43861 / JCM 3304 / KCC A-0304 / NBRC 14216 / KM-6054) TaxID=452652 RepID=E4MZK5_KITSK|nr:MULTISPECIES: DUF350 domain-containing protein [Kitasatospora]BAJ29939.1 hypothetical protein KSE_41530 [Kitasatospora setae KM-6054]
MNDILHQLGYAAAYGAVGLVLLLLGVLLVDALTPGELRRQIWVERNRNAAVVLSSALLAIGAIVFTAVMSTYQDFVKGLVAAAVFGLFGLLLMAVSFRVLDLVTPGRLGELLVDDEPHPAVWVTASTNLAVAAIVSAAIY